MRQRDWDARCAQAAESRFDVGRISTSAQAVIGLLEKLLTVAVIGFGAVLVFDGQMTVGNGIRFPPFATGAFVPLAVPPSPDEANTDTPLSAAALNASRRFSSDAALPNASSAEPKLCEITCTLSLSIRYFSAFIMFGKPWTPSVSAPVVATRMMLAPGAIA